MMHLLIGHKDNQCLAACGLLEGDWRECEKLVDFVSYPQLVTCELCQVKIQEEGVKEDGTKL